MRRADRIALWLLDACGYTLAALLLVALLFLPDVFDQRDAEPQPQPATQVAKVQCA